MSSPDEQSQETVQAPEAVPTTDEERAAAERLRVFQGLPPEVQANDEIRRRFGLGDAVEIVARPIARMLRMKNCGPCKQRQAKLNEKLSIPLPSRRRRGPL